MEANRDIEEFTAFDSNCTKSAKCQNIVKYDYFPFKKFRTCSQRFLFVFSISFIFFFF